MSDLYRLAYISSNTIHGGREQVRAQIEAILAAAHRKNPALGVTGALLYSGGYFCQVIEGPQEAIEELFETIQMDDRHGEVTVLHFEPIEERGFDDWAMAFVGIEDEMRFDLDAIKASTDELAMRKAGEDMVVVLDRLVRDRQATLGG